MRGKDRDKYARKRLRQKMIKTFERLKGQSLEKKSRALWFNRKYRLCAMISKDHSDIEYYPQKYWFTLIKNQKQFLNNAEKSYVFLGFLDNDQSACLVPYNPHRKKFNGHDEKRFDIGILPNLDDNNLGVNLSEFMEPLK